MRTPRLTFSAPPTLADAVARYRDELAEQTGMFVSRSAALVSLVKRGLRSDPTPPANNQQHYELAAKSTT